MKLVLSLALLLAAAPAVEAQELLAAPSSSGSVPAAARVELPRMPTAEVATSVREPAVRTRIVEARAIQKADAAVARERSRSYYILIGAVIVLGIIVATQI